jgi:general secretion pathway protein A
MNLELALKTLWGAKRWPGQAGSTLVFEHPAWVQCMRGLDQTVSLHSSAIVHGPHGTGKSYLLHHWSERLSPKQYKLVRLSHSSLSGGDLLRHLVRLAGKEPKFRKSDNVAVLSATWAEWAPVWPVLVVEEAQDLSVTSLEELRLLTCARTDAQQAFSLILSGDDCLLPRLELTINAALLSRLTCNLQLRPWPAKCLDEYVDARLADAGIHGDILEPPARTLLIQAAKGTPRTLVAVLQKAMEAATLDERRRITVADMQAGVDAVPSASAGYLK